ncbi:unnamed protein product, partial [Symbiodinium pilosum]
DCKSSPEHFFRKMNEWTNMEDGEKLSLLKQLRDASKVERSEKTLAQVLCAVAAALSPPRASSECKELIGIMAHGAGRDQEANVAVALKLQGRIRFLL